LVSWTPVFLDEHPLAVCNDGSPAAYYYRKGAEGSPRWLIFLQGGGWCFDRESCLGRRAQPAISSSDEFPRSAEEVEQWAARYASEGVLHPTRSPLKDAHVAYVRYCTSDAHLGDAGASEATFGMHFRGSHVLRAVLQDLRSRTGLGERRGDLLVHAGCSAGGRGALASLDHVAEALQDTGAHVLGLLDAALYVPLRPMLRAEGLDDQTRRAFALHNSTAFMGQCAKHFPEGEQWKCIFGSYRLPLVRSPYVLSADQYDVYQISVGITEEGANNFPPSRPESQEEIAHAEAFRRLTREHIPRILMRADAQSSAGGATFFSPACYVHCLSDSSAFYGLTVGETSLADALQRALSAGPSGSAAIGIIENCAGFKCGACQYDMTE